jgi:hypothetical protein
MRLARGAIITVVALFLYVLLLGMLGAMGPVELAMTVAAALITGWLLSRPGARRDTSGSSA